jgi:hypothetical protein
MTKNFFPVCTGTGIIYRIETFNNVSKKKHDHVMHVNFGFECIYCVYND